MYENVFGRIIQSSDSVSEYETPVPILIFPPLLTFFCYFPTIVSLALVQSTSKADYVLHVTNIYVIIVHALRDYNAVASVCT